MPVFGKRITRNEGQRLLTKELNVTRPVKGHLELFLAHPSLSDHKNYYCKETNVFVFDVSLIKELVKYTENGTDKEATHLAIIMGSQEADGEDTTSEPFFRGDRTIIVGACIMEDEEFKSIPVLKPAVEHPPRRSKIEFPPGTDFDNGAKGAITITLL